MKSFNKSMDSQGNQNSSSSTSRLVVHRMHPSMMGLLDEISSGRSNLSRKEQEDILKIASQCNHLVGLYSPISSIGPGSSSVSRDSYPQPEKDKHTPKGENDLPGLTGVGKPRTRGPKRASKIKKLSNPSKEDNVKKHVNTYHPTFTTKSGEERS